MAQVSEITRPIYFDGDELTLDTDATFGIWRRPDGEGFDAFIEPVPIQRRQRLTRNDLIRFWGEKRVEKAEAAALQAWVDADGPADLRAARAEERYDEEAAA